MAPASLTALIFTKNVLNAEDEQPVEAIIITHEAFISKWVDWDEANDDFDLCVKLAWDYLCSKCDEVADGEGYVRLPDYDADEEHEEWADCVLEGEVGGMVSASLGYAEHMAGNMMDQDPE